MSFKSLANEKTWESEKQTPKLIPSVTLSAPDVNDTPTLRTIHNEYDIPEQRESLNTLVKNLSTIVEKLKKQIHELDQKPL